MIAGLKRGVTLEWGVLLLAALALRLVYLWQWEGSIFAEVAVGEAARNLLGNALRHGQQPVSIGVTRTGPEAALWIEDAGQGPDASVIARLGDRFNRSAASGEQETSSPPLVCGSQSRSVSIADI